MSTNRLFKVLIVIAVLIGSTFLVGTASATPGTGITSEPIASGNLSGPVSAKFKTDFGVVHTDVSKVTMVKLTITPGGAAGCHQHGGPLWAVVASGTMTFYDGDDPSCAGKVYPQGSAFMDPGDHTHNVRNEGSENLVIYVIFMLPEGAAARIDEPAPGNCPF